MFLELSRSVLRKSFGKLYYSLSKLDALIDSMAGDSEDRINKAIEKHLEGYSLHLGTIPLENQYFDCSVETETCRSHGKTCRMVLPSGEFRTELGDLIIAVDHILVDSTESNQTTKVISGACSFIQTKKEALAKKGLSKRQLYLMTQWPKFRYKGKYWEFRLFPDNSSFYLFILDPSSKQQPKSRLISSVMLLKFLKESKTSLLRDINGTVPLRNLGLLQRKQLNNSKIPVTFSSFVIRSLYLSLGSQSIEIRTFLRNIFFPELEEAQDCSLVSESIKITNSKLKMKTLY